MALRIVPLHNSPRRRKKEDERYSPYISALVQEGGGNLPLTAPPSGNLQLWLAADDIIGLVDNDPVTTWEDSSAANNDATQGVAASKPIYKTNILNGLPVVRFDAVDDGMLTANQVAGWTSAGSPLSFFIVYGVTDTTVASRRAIQGDSGPFNWLMGPYSGKYKVHNGTFIDGPDLVASQFVLCTYIHDGTTGRFWVDGVFIGSNTNGVVPRQIGLGASGAFAEPLNGDIAEVIGYDIDKTSQRVAIEQYLSRKYAL